MFVERWPGNFLLGSHGLFFLFRVRLAQLFLGVALLGSPVGGLSQLLLERRERKCFVQLAWSLLV